MLEITDLLVDIDPASGRRYPVHRAEVAHRLRDDGEARAARVVGRLPANDGVLDDEFVDRLLISVHGEIQRLSEEFRHGDRIACLLGPLIATLRTTGRPGPYRIVDLGCGTGYVVRWLARHAAMDDVEYVGVDYNAALVDEARRLARAEHLPCRFFVSDAFSSGGQADLLISSGVLHHVPADHLGDLFAHHESGPAVGFVHVDFQPSALAPIGAWLFHRARMRLAIARFDGVQSARRAHAPSLLGETAARHAPSFRTWIHRGRVRHTPFPGVFASIIGVRHPFAETAISAFGRRARQLEGAA